METRSLSPKHAHAPMVPVIGMGTSQTLDTDDLRLARDVVGAALDAGTTLFDSSPMYGKAERVLGTVLAPRRAEALVATKVWTDDDAVAERQIADSLSFAGGHIDLLQVHNMVRWPERLRRIEELRDAGQVGFVGATHWRPSNFDELEAAMVTGRLDAIQIPYNPREREVEARLLPLAADLGLGVLIMRPFGAGDLMGDPPTAAELAPLASFGITTWGQALLAWGLSHPTTTVSIPATSKPARAVENAAAGDHPTLDTEHRDLVAALATRRG
ncbi:MAG: aldo/keto reductase [Actinobacteria bacterium]|nr:aldo/keto reductase [Actinomycetota bacterium]